MISRNFLEFARTPITAIPYLPTLFLNYVHDIAPLSEKWAKLQGLSSKKEGSEPEDAIKEGEAGGANGGVVGTRTSLAFLLLSVIIGVVFFIKYNTAKKFCQKRIISF
jgi:hypothetical protein